MALARKDASVVGFFCPTCDGPCFETHNFCGICGKPLFKDCPQCHTRVTAESTTCYGCGYAFRSLPVDAQRPQPLSYEEYMEQTSYWGNSSESVLALMCWHWLFRPTP